MDYRNKSVLLASKHEKEKAIAEVFFAKLSCTLDVQAAEPQYCDYCNP